MVNAAEARRFVTLDGMRGLAALAIITDHVDSPFFNAALPGRYLAVDFFFVLSGFVLSHVYGRRLADGLSALAFMRARFIRLYPLYLVGLLAGAALTAILVLKGWNDASWGDIAAATALGLVMAPTPEAISPSIYNIYPFDGPAWSLFFELIANLAFGLVFLRLTKSVLAGILVLGAVGVGWVGLHFGELAGGFNADNFIAGFPRVTFGFFAGVLVHRLYLKHPAPALPPLAAFAALLAVFAVPAQGAWRALFDVLAALLIFPVLVAVCADSSPRGALARAASALGALSYGVYILHVPVRDWLRTVLAVLAPGVELPGIAMVASVAALTVAAAALLHVVYDEPVRRWLSRRLVKRPM
jgi:peptidoglycan/LPS O-acetylase OafA/YrhL